MNGWRARQFSPGQSTQHRELMMVACPCGEPERGGMPKAWEILPNTYCTARSAYPQGKTDLLIRDTPEKAAVGDSLRGRKDLREQNGP